MPRAHEAAKILEWLQREYHKGLTRQERAAIEAYQDTGHFLNRALRETTDENEYNFLDARVRGAGFRSPGALVQALDEILDQAPRLPEPLTLFRKEINDPRIKRGDWRRLICRQRLILGCWMK